AQIDRHPSPISNQGKFATQRSEAVHPVTACRRALQSFACCLLVVLSACVSPALSPTAPVPAPLSEQAAMQGEILARYATFQRMACLSSAAYVGRDTDRDRCWSWTNGPGTRIQSAPIRLVDFWGHPYDSYYIIWTDDLDKQQAVAIRGT